MQGPGVGDSTIYWSAGSDGGWGRCGERRMATWVGRAAFLRDLVLWMREFRLSPEVISSCHFNVLSGISLPEVVTPKGVTSAPENGPA